MPVTEKNGFGLGLGVRLGYNRRNWAFMNAMTIPCLLLVSCSAHVQQEMVWQMMSNFMHLFLECGKDYYMSLPIYTYIANLPPYSEFP